MIRKWVGCLLIKEGQEVTGFCHYVSDEVKKVLIKAISDEDLPLSGGYRAYIVVKRGWSMIELVSLKGGNKIIKVQCRRVLMFDGDYANALLQVLREGTGMEGATKVVPMHVAQHPPVGMTICSGPKVLLKLKPDPFGLHA